MRTGAKRAVSIAVVLGAAVVAHAIGNGDIKPVGGGHHRDRDGDVRQRLGNRDATEHDVRDDVQRARREAMTAAIRSSGSRSRQTRSCSFGPMSSRNVTVNCPPRGGPAMRRCLFHATNNANQVPLADFVGVCLYGQTPGTLVPQQTSLDFGTVAVGQESELALDIRHAGTLSQTITRVYLQTNDADANFRFAAPCNPDAPSCDAELLAPAHLNDLFSIGVRCSPQSPGMHTAQIFVGTDTFQLLSTPVTVQCIGGATTAPVLAANPPHVEIAERIEVGSGSASTIVHLSNPGGAADRHQRHPHRRRRQQRGGRLDLCRDRSVHRSDHVDVLARSGRAPRSQREVRSERDRAPPRDAPHLVSRHARSHEGDRARRYRPGRDAPAREPAA